VRPGKRVDRRRREGARVGEVAAETRDASISTKQHGDTDGDQALRTLSAVLTRNRYRVLLVPSGAGLARRDASCSWI
jgi:hypothetical protein